MAANTSPRPEPDVVEADAADHEDRERLARVDRKRRIVALMEQAAKAPDPIAIVEHVRALRTAWREIGEVGRLRRELTPAYKFAVREYWARYKAAQVQAPTQSPAPAPFEHIERLKRWLGR